MCSSFTSEAKRRGSETAAELIGRLLAGELVEGRGETGRFPHRQARRGLVGNMVSPTGASRGRATSSCLPVGAVGAGEQLERMGERGPEHGEAVATPAR